MIKTRALYLVEKRKCEDIKFITFSNFRFFPTCWKHDVLYNIYRLIKWIYNGYYTVDIMCQISFNDVVYFTLITMCK